MQEDSAKPKLLNSLLMKKILIVLGFLGFIVRSTLPLLLCTGFILPVSDDSFLFGANILKLAFHCFWFI